MDSRGIDRIDELPVADTPEDVAVLYSWANLHGAKYRDFSASRREYRAQLRHRAAEQVREQELTAQAEAEAAASSADAAVKAAEQQAESTEFSQEGSQADSVREQALREAGRAARIAAAERVEAARRAEAAAVAEAAARTAEREIAEAGVSARKQAARYAESEIRIRESGAHQPFQVPGEISDPYTPSYQAEQAERRHDRPVPLHTHHQPALDDFADRFEPIFENAEMSERSEGFYDAATSQPDEMLPDREARLFAPATFAEVPGTIGPDAGEGFSQSGNRASQSSAIRRPQGYRPDAASGVRQIYRAPEFDEPQAEYIAAEPVNHLAAPRPLRGAYGEEAASQRGGMNSAVNQAANLARNASTNPPNLHVNPPARGASFEPMAESLREPVRTQGPPAQAGWPFTSAERPRTDATLRPALRREPPVGAEVAPQSGLPQRVAPPQGGAPPRNFAPSVAPIVPATGQRPVSPYAQPVASDASRGRRVQDELGYKPGAAFSDPARQIPPPAPKSKISSPQRTPYVADPSGPAWLYAPQTPVAAPQRPVPSAYFASPIGQSSVADTLQHSRERVAARWFALKGVFEQPGQDQQETPVRQKETRTPVLAVFSLAGGVGKTSLVATLGRALSSLGEKVLLTDTTSHGLLPFYFGASELRQGVVRTFSPPSGSTDAPIYLVSYNVDQRVEDEEIQTQLVDEIAGNSKGMHRILLDLTPASGWVALRMAAMNPTVLVPLAPDMNSVISLQAVEKYFQGTVDADGRPLQPFFVINQFDASLPLHLDVREVLRRQLGDRLLPFVIRRAPAVSEALAEGMTVMDYAPETPIAEDYQNVAAWLRTIAAPATAGFRNVRWSER
jgi:cellulose synthase operon protein YhjQ